MSPDLPEGERAAGGDVLDPGAGGRVGLHAAQQPAREGLARQVRLALPRAELAEPRRGHDTLCMHISRIISIVTFPILLVVT